MATTILLTVSLMGIIMLMMSVGVIFSGHCLRGSCGGPDIVGPNGESLLCATCPKRAEREQSQAGELVSLANDATQS